MARKPGEIYLGLKDQEILLPAYGGRKVTPRKRKILVEEEALDGSLVSDLIGVRPSWSITYDQVLLGPDMEELEKLSDLRQTLNLIIVDRLGRVKEYDVKLQPIEPTREAIYDDWEWSGVSLELEAIKCYR